MILIKKRPNKDDDDKNIASSGQWIIVVIKNVYDIHF
jgi:hypothetical protein